MDSGRVLVSEECADAAIRLLVYTDEPLNAVALERLFSHCNDIKLSGVVCELAEVVSRVPLESIDVLLLTVHDAADGLFLSELYHRSPKTRVVLWVRDISPESAYHAIECGVRGILRKTLPPDMLLKCVRKVHDGELWFEKTLTELFLSGRKVKVSSREAQLITFVTQGLKNKEIASVMSLTEGTVKVYLSRLFEKVGVRDRFELGLFGLRNTQSGSEVYEKAAGPVHAACNRRQDAVTPERNRTKSAPAQVFFVRAAR